MKKFDEVNVSPKTNCSSDTSCASSRTGMDVTQYNSKLSGEVIWNPQDQPNHQAQVNTITNPKVKVERFELEIAECKLMRTFNTAQYRSNSPTLKENSSAGDYVHIGENNRVDLFEYRSCVLSTAEDDLQTIPKTHSNNFQEKLLQSFGRLVQDFIDGLEAELGTQHRSCVLSTAEDDLQTIPKVHSNNFQEKLLQSFGRLVQDFIDGLEAELGTQHSLDLIGLVNAIRPKLNENVQELCDFVSESSTESDTKLYSDNLERQKEIKENRNAQLQSRNEVAELEERNKKLEENKYNCMEETATKLLEHEEKNCALKVRGKLFEERGVQVVGDQDELITSQASERDTQCEIENLKLVLSKANSCISQLREQILIQQELHEVYREEIKMLQENDNKQRIQIEELSAQIFSNNGVIKQLTDDLALKSEQVRTLIQSVKSKEMVLVWQAHRVELLKENSERHQSLILRKNQRIGILEDEIANLNNTLALSHQGDENDG